MPHIALTGVVYIGDDTRCRDGAPGAILIGDTDLLLAVQEADFANPVTFGFLDHSYKGDLSYEIGWGYSEYTPMDSDGLTVGPHNIIDILGRYEGQELTVVISDTAIDLAYIIEETP